MTRFSRRLLITGLIAAAAVSNFLTFSPVFAESAVLTITGNVSNPNRGGYDEATDKFFGYTEVEFDKATTFNSTELEKLKMVSVKADFPQGRSIHTYEGPSLADVLAAAGATGDKVTVQALDGYAVEAPLDEMLAQGAIVALKRDGIPFAIGDFGPTQIVFPRAERADLKDMPDDRWVWSVFHIRVE
ncbi:MAG: molybdopterin-dependent oxidoreductase [Rhodobacteraceae bacterium]|nr:molybdopterin-dependent oxidoreductase [Paracoccaceae bacterium]